MHVLWHITAMWLHMLGHIRLKTILHVMTYTTDIHDLVYPHKGALASHNTD